MEVGGYFKSDLFTEQSNEDAPAEWFIRAGSREVPDDYVLQMDGVNTGAATEGRPTVRATDRRRLKFRLAD
jgi:hypothetical protein